MKLKPNQFIVTSALIAIIGCTPPPAKTASKPPLQEVQRILKNQPQPAQQVQMAIIQDYSPSIAKQGVPKLSSQYIEPILEYMQTHHGGELAVGEICTNSNKPLLRVKIDTPPRLHKWMFNNLPSPESYRQTLKKQGENNFEIRRRVREYRPKYEAATAADWRVFDQHLQHQQTWRQQTQSRINSFRQQLKPLLNQGFSCAETDIIGGLRRADIFLAEAAKTNPRKYAILITDGIHTIGGNTKVEWQSNSQLLLVGGANSPGIFKALPYKPFESIQSAIDFSLTDPAKGKGAS